MMGRTEPDSQGAPVALAEPSELALVGQACWACDKLGSCPGAQGVRLLRCSRCSRGWFCGRECQVAALAGHKKMCALGKRAAGPQEGAGEWAARVETALSPLSSDAVSPAGVELLRRSFLLTPRCERCGSLSALSCCPLCRCGWSCSACEASVRGGGAHAPQCERNRRSQEVEHLLRFCARRLGLESAAQVPFTIQPEGALASPAAALPASWPAFWAWRGVPADDRARWKGHLPVALRLASRDLSWALTAVQALYRFAHPATQAAASAGRALDLEVHVVGAEPGAEYPPSSAWEEVQHLLPAVRELRVAFVGPGVPLSDEEPQRQWLAVEPCDACAAQGRARKELVATALYHEFCVGDEYTRPDLVLVCNPAVGGAEQQEWFPTLDLLAHQGVSCVFTAPDEREAHGDALVYDAFGLDALAAPERNAFASECELRDPSSSAGVSFYASNAWLTCRRCKPQHAPAPEVAMARLVDAIKARDAARADR